MRRLLATLLTLALAPAAWAEGYMVARTPTDPLHLAQKDIVIFSAARTPQQQASGGFGVIYPTLSTSDEGIVVLCRFADDDASVLNASASGGCSPGDTQNYDGWVAGSCDPGCQANPGWDGSENGSVWTLDTTGSSSNISGQYRWVSSDGTNTWSIDDTCSSPPCFATYQMRVKIEDGVDMSSDGLGGDGLMKFNIMYEGGGSCCDNWVFNNRLAFQTDGDLSPRQGPGGYNNQNKMFRTVFTSSCGTTRDFQPGGDTSAWGKCIPEEQPTDSHQEWPVGEWFTVTGKQTLGEGASDRVQWWIAADSWDCEVEIVNLLIDDMEDIFHHNAFASFIITGFMTGSGPGAEVFSMWHNDIIIRDSVDIPRPNQGVSCGQGGHA